MIALLDLQPVPETAESPPTSPPAPSQEVVLQELLKTVSASRLSLWASCRLKFFFRYVQKIRKPPTPNMHAGTVVHSVLQSWNLARWRNEPFQTERFKALFLAQWKALQANLSIDWQGEESDEKCSALFALENYFLETPIKASEKPEAVEVQVETDLAQHGLPRLIGVIDLVRAGRRIVDFKVVGKTPEPGQLVHTHQTQLSCYSVLYRDATGNTEAGLELHHLVRTKKPKVIVTSLPPMVESRRTRLFKQIDSYQSGLARQDFVPSPGFQCAGCENFDSCRTWS